MVKVISLSNEAYEKLKAIKNGKSFSEVVVDLVDCKRKSKKDITKFAGIFKDDKEWKNIMEEISEDRINFKLREVKF
jgi:predicted CopG family antitoxin